MKNNSTPALDILKLVDKNTVNADDYLIAETLINTLSRNEETSVYLDRLVLFVSNSSNLDTPERSGNENYELYYQKLSNDNELKVNKMILTIRPLNTDNNDSEGLDVDHFIESLQAFNDAVLLDKISEAMKLSELNIPEDKHHLLPVGNHDDIAVLNVNALAQYLDDNGCAI